MQTHSFLRDHQFQQKKSRMKIFPISLSGTKDQIASQVHQINYAGCLRNHIFFRLKKKYIYHEKKKRKKGHNPNKVYKRKP